MKKLIIIMISLALIMHDFDKNDVDHNTLIITVIFKIIFFFFRRRSLNVHRDLLENKNQMTFYRCIYKNNFKHLFPF